MKHYALLGIILLASGIAFCQPLDSSRILKPKTVNIAGVDHSCFDPEQTNYLTEQVVKQKYADSVEVGLNREIEECKRLSQQKDLKIHNQAKTIQVAEENTKFLETWNKTIQKEKEQLLKDVAIAEKKKWFYMGIGALAGAVISNLF